jgi:hypothetical protein
MPFERDVYVDLLLKFLEEVEKQKKNSV